MKNLQSELKSTNTKIYLIEKRLDSFGIIINSLNKQLSDTISEKEYVINEYNHLKKQQDDLLKKIAIESEKVRQRLSENEVLPKNPIGANDDEMFYEDFKTCF